MNSRVSKLKYKSKENFKNPDGVHRSPVTDSYKRPWHLLSKMIDHMKQIASVVIPSSCMMTPISLELLGHQGLPTVIAKLLFIEHSTCPLPCNICDPDTADSLTTLS